MMGGRSLYEQVYASAKGDCAAFHDAFSKNFVPLHNELLELPGTRAHIVFGPFNDSLDPLRVSLLMADRTFVHLFPRRSSMLLSELALAGKHSISLPTDVVSRVRSVVPPGPLRSRGLKLLSAGGGYSALLFKRLAPLIRSGHVRVRPRLMAAIASIPNPTVATPKGMRLAESWAMLPVDSDSKLFNWKIDALDHPMSSIPIRMGSPRVGMEREILSMLVPMVSGVSLDAVADILMKEQSTLSAFRAAIQESVDRIKRNESSADSEVENRLRPAIDELTRRWQEAAKHRLFRIGGIVIGSATLALSSLTQEGLAAAFLRGLGGTGGIVGVANELAELSKDRAALRGNPWYPMWRITRSKRH